MAEESMAEEEDRRSADMREQMPRHTQPVRFQRLEFDPIVEGPAPIVTGTNPRDTPIVLRSKATLESAPMQPEVSNAVLDTVGVTEPVPTGDIKSPSGKVPANRPAARTAVGAAVLQNSTAIILTLAGLSEQIDEKIDELEQKLWNSDENQALRDEAIAIYVDLRQIADALRDTASKFPVGTVEEERVVKTTTSFAEALNNYWNKRHIATFDIAVFLTALGICQLLGDGGQIAAAICGALVGGKSIADVIKAVAKGNNGD